MNGYQAERLAEEIVREFRPGLLTKPGRFPTHEFFEFYLPRRYHLNTGVEDLPVGIEGITRPNGTIRIAPHVYDAMVDEEDGRPRLTPVHEGIHGIVHLPTLRRLKRALVEGGENGPALYRREDLPPFFDPEWQANRVAGAILMPWRAVAAVVDRYGKDPQALMEAFGVSRQAAGVRFYHLERLGRIK